MARAACVIPATTPSLSRSPDISPVYLALASVFPPGSAVRRLTAGARRREHRGNSAFLACTREVRTMNITYLIYEAERPRSTAEQREADVRAGELAAAVARLGHSP